MHAPAGCLSPAYTEHMSVLLSSKHKRKSNGLCALHLRMLMGSARSQP